MNFTDVPAGKIAAVVTSLEMRAQARPRAERDGCALTLALVPKPPLDWYRQLFRTVGDRSGEARFYINIGIINQRSGQAVAAESAYDRAL